MIGLPIYIVSAIKENQKEKKEFIEEQRERQIVHLIAQSGITSNFKGNFFQDVAGIGGCQRGVRRDYWFGKSSSFFFSIGSASPRRGS